MIRQGITDTTEVKELCDIATDIVGLEQGSLSSFTRKEPYTLARQVVANICLHQGIHFVTIAKVLIVTEVIFTTIKKTIQETLRLG